MYAFLSRVRFAIQRWCIALKPEQGQVVHGDAPFPCTGLRSLTTAEKSAPPFFTRENYCSPQKHPGEGLCTRIRVVLCPPQEGCSGWLRSRRFVVPQLHSALVHQPELLDLCFVSQKQRTASPALAGDSSSRKHSCNWKSQLNSILAVLHSRTSSLIGQKLGQ